MTEPLARLAYTPAEAATLLGVCRATIYNRMADGTLASVKFGRSRRITAEALAEALEQARLPGPSEPRYFEDGDDIAQAIRDLQAEVARLRALLEP